MNKFYSAGMILILLLVTIFTGCGSNPGDPNPNPTPTPTPTVLFSDNFDTYSGTPWTPEGGWTNYMLAGASGNHWNVATDDKVLEVNTSKYMCLINDYSGNNGNYKISAKIKFAAIALGAGATNLRSEMGVIGRAQVDGDDENFYLVSVSYYVDDDLNLGGTVNLSLIMRNNSGVSYIKPDVLLLSGSPDTSIFYTLTLTVNGSTITGNISGGAGAKALNGTITATDDTFSGAEIGGGKVGLYVFNTTDAGVTYPISHLDDFVVTTP